MQKRKINLPFFLPFAVAGVCALVGWVRTDFSIEKISAPLSYNSKGAFPKEKISSTFRFLGRGRQSFVFVSEDGDTVLKFFDQTYFQMPWYASFSKKWKESEINKRELRKQFYLNSYLLAEEFLKEETGTLYVHLGLTQSLPSIRLIDRASRTFTVDLNQLPFVLQKRASPLYASINSHNLHLVVHNFIDLVKKRMALNIVDQEHDVEHNFGMREGQILYLDPGRLSKGEFKGPDRLNQEWWSATHRFRDWLKEKYPEIIPFFDSQIAAAKREE